MFLLIDNYDSFTFILQDYFARIGYSCTVMRNDDKSVYEFAGLKPEAIILSPGPETPAKAGNLLPLIKYFHDKIPILGICLGHQGIGEFFGCHLVQAKKPMHGKTSIVHHNNHPLFKTIPDPITVIRYHSLILENINLDELEVIAETEEGEVMAIAGKKYPVCGIQFHPESVLTEFGIKILYNWLAWSRLLSNKAL